MKALLSTSSTVYRSRVVYVNATQWTGDNIDDIQKMLKTRGFDWDSRHGLSILTPSNGMVKVPVGHYVVIDSQGNREAMSKDDFEIKYTKD